jgi:myosin heavy subunit
LIRSQGVKIADLVRGIAQQAQTLASVLARAEEKVRDMRRGHTHAVQEAAHAATALLKQQQAGRLAEATKTLLEERTNVGVLRSQMDKLAARLAAKLLEGEQGAAEGARQQQRIQTLEQQVNFVVEQDTDLRAALQAVQTQAASAARDVALHREAMELLQQEAHTSRNRLLANKLRTFQTQALARSFAFWLRVFKASQMNRILEESVSMDSTLDTRIADALSRKRPRHSLPPSSPVPLIGTSSVSPPPSLPAEASSVDL